MDPLYESTGDSLSPGDIFVDLPSIVLREPQLTILRRRDLTRGPGADLYVVGDPDHQPRRSFNPEGDEAAVRVQQANGILLTHGCEIDNRPRGRLVIALVRPITSVPEENAKEAIRNGRNLAFLWLPPNDSPELQESYVDFSRVTTVSREVLTDDRRLLSGSEALVKALFVGVVRYFTRWEIPDQILAQLAAETLAGT